MAVRVSVIKIGGSVLNGAVWYQRVARFIATLLAQDPNRRLIVVVSAENGTTDALLALAREVSSEPDPAALDLLWSTGELRSVALLALSLHGVGVRATVANVHQTGLVEPDARLQPERIGLRPLRVLSRFAEADVIVAPGFLAESAGAGVVSLGRGGSDLTAVLLAAGINAEACELIKDVPGYFSSDPNRSDGAEHIATMSYAQALRMADEGCDLVQRRALAAARDHNLRLVIRAIADPRQTVVHT